MTGTGKTLIYLVPILEKLFADPFGIFALVISPTRELAIHIHQQFLFFGSKMNIKASLLIGGENYVTQSVELDQIPHVIIATPGKLYDMLENNDILKKYIKNLRFLVLDEFDRLLDSSLLYFLDPVLKKLPVKKQVILTTATFDEKMSNLKFLQEQFNLDANRKLKYFNQNKEIKVVETIKHFYIFVPKLLRDYYFLYVMKEECEKLDGGFEGSLIVFFRQCK